MLKKLNDVLKKHIEEFLYRYIHYDVKVSVALIYSKSKDAKDKIESSIRATDKFIQVSKYLFVVFYQYANTEDEARAACENLVEKIDSSEKKSKTLLAYTNFHEDDKNADTIINRIHIIFDEAVRKKEYFKSDEDFFDEYEKYYVDFKDI